MKKIRLLRKDVEKIDPPIPVVISQFGGIVGNVIVGRAISRTSKLVFVETHEKHITKNQAYRLDTGVRDQDVGKAKGLKINLADLETKQDRFSAAECAKNIKLDLRTSEYIGDNNRAVYEVWHDENGHYIKGYTEETLDGDKVKHTTRVIPFSFLKTALSEFCKF